MTSDYINRPLRSQAQVLRKRHMEVLTELSVHLRSVATMHDNSAQNWRMANLPNRQAAALEWILDQIDEDREQANKLREGE